MNNFSLKFFEIHQFKLLLFVHFLFGFYAVGHLHPDEHFQIFEFLGYKFGQSSASDLPWEFRSHMRPWIQPFTYYLFAYPLKLLGISNFSLMTLIRILHSVLALFLTLSIYKKYSEKSSVSQNLTNFTLFNLLWFFPFLHSRISSEVVSGLIFFSSYFLINERQKNLVLFSVGLMWGLAIQIRYHIGIMVLFYGLNQILFNRKQFGQIAPLALGIMIITSLAGLIDFWGYGTWSFPPWNYLYENLVLGKASSFGESPWYYYFKKLQQKGIPPISWILIFSFIYFWIKKWRSPITWMSLSFFLVHCFISHKELRFIFPLAPLAPIVLYSLFSDFSLPKKFTAIFCGMNLLLLPLSLWRSPNPFVSFLRSVDQKEIETLHYVGGESPYGLAKLKPNFIVEKYPNLIRIASGKELVNQSQNIDHLLVIHAQDARYVPKNCQIGWSRVPSWFLKSAQVELLGKSKIMAFYRCKK